MIHVGYLQYHRDVQFRGDIMSAVECSVPCGDIILCNLSTVGIP